ncbi:MAG: hypothetical protein ACQKBY_09090, partial [Verrucomicrobiales bacterium]
MAVILVGFLSFGAASVRSATHQSAEAVAKANARMALMVAIGQLQGETGADRRVTGRADLAFDAAPNAQWTGAWDNEAANPEPVWLVSGRNVDPQVALGDGNSALLASEVDGVYEELRAPLVEVPGSEDGDRYAYWIGDEGVKARVDLAKGEETTEERRRRALAASAQMGDVTKLGADFTSAQFGPESAEDQTRYVTLETLGLASGNAEVPREYFHEVTTGGYGLPVNVREGGMKADLSLVFDRSQQNESFVSRVLGGRPQATTYGSSRVYDFSVTDADAFYLSESIAGQVGGGAGPNWGNFYNYARLWENKLGSEFRHVGLYPKVDTNLRQQDWMPYKNDGSQAFLQDRQHKNSGVTPVLALVQIGVYLGAEPSAPPSLPEGQSPPAANNYYRATLHIKPVVGMWNPYNVPIKAERYRFEWAFAPFLRIDFQKPSANGSFPNGSGYVTEMWLRDYWRIASNGNLPTDASPQGGSYIRLETDPVDFEPGEFRLFSAAGTTQLSSSSNKLVPELDVNGSYKFGINASQTTANRTVKGQPLIIPEDYYGWFGDVVLQDSHWNGNVSGTSFQGGTRRHFNNNLDEDASPTWVTFKKIGGGDVHLSRYSNLWNGGKNENATRPFLPERILTDRSNLHLDGSGGKTPHLVQDLSAGNLGPVGTWRFEMRNPTEIDDANQRARAWIDSNPAAPVGNVFFDGSKAPSSGREGWGTLSHFIAGAHRSGSRAGVVGDGGGGNRGLVAEGSYWSKAIPQGDVSDANRWRGYLGGGSTPINGVTHAVIYDVPQSPLVSLGQLQHAQASRYQYEPGFVLGNSYANPRIPLDQTTVANFAGMNGFTMVDSSYELNERLWDGYFFSTLAPDYVSTSGGTYDSALSFENLAEGAEQLPNPRMVFRPESGDQDFAGILSAAGNRAPEAMASRVRVAGAFNVNSTSVGAWKAVLSSMGASELPWINPETGNVSWTRPEGVRFNRFSQPITDQPFEGNAYAAEY